MLDRGPCERPISTLVKHTKKKTPHIAVEVVARETRRSFSDVFLIFDLLDLLGLFDF